MMRIWRQNMLKKKEVLAVFAVIIMLGIAFENVVFGASRNEKEENDANDAGENVLDVGLPIDNDETGGDINNGYMEDDGKLENIEKVTLVDDGEGSFERDKSTYDWPTFHHDMQRTGYTSGLGDIISPSIKWKYNDNTPYCNAPVIADINNDGNNEVIQTMSDFIRAFNGATGDLLWEFPVNSGNHDTPTVFDVDSDGEMEVIAGARDENTLYCIDGATGDEEWHFQVPLADPYYIQNSPAVGDVDNDGSVEIVFNVEFYGIFCVSGSDGTEKWNVSTGGGMTTWTSPAIYDSDADNYLEIFTNRGGTIYCLNGLDGAIQWHTSFRYHSSLICDPTIYDVDDDGDTEVIFGGLYNLDPPSSDEIGIFCLNAEDGQEEWRFVLGENLPNDDFLSPVIGDVDGDGYKEIICAGYWKYSGFNPVFCLDGKTGNEEWNYSAQPDAGWIHPAMCDIDGDGDIEVLIGNRLDGKLYCINANNGSLKWTYENIGEIQCSPVIGDVDNDGTVEIAITGGGDLYYLQNDFGPQPPVPVLNGPYRAGTGDTIHFNAADSWDPDGYIVGYRWDWTNDGIWDTEWLSTPTIDHIYKDPFNGTVAVEVKDDENLTSIGTESIQIDETPPIAWNKTWGSLGSDNGKSVQQTSDGGYILTGSFGSELCLIKTDTNGNEEWVRLYGGADLEEGKSVQQTSDGGYIVAGFTSSYGAGGCDFWLLKTDSSGNEEWNKTFGTADYFDSAYSVQQTNDGGYIITGSKYYGKAWLIKTDSYGDEEWNKILDDGCGYSVRQTIDGGYIIGGVFKEGDKYKAGLIKTDSDGNQQWKKTFSFSYGYSVWQTNDSGYIFTGGEYPAFLIKTDNNGNLEWNRTFELWFGQSVQQTADGGYIVSGNSGSSWNYKTFFIKTDRNGTMLWCRKIERSGGGGVAIQTTDKGYILLTNDAIHDKIWLIKFGWSPPTADTGGPYYGNPGYPVSFDGGNSHDNDENGQSIVRYDWKFFDGDTWHNDIGPMPTYTYMNVGNYTVTLRVWDDEGNNDTDATRVYINYLPHPPTANAGGPYHVMEDDVLILNASLSHDNDENGSRIVRYDWKFFDGDVWHNDNGSNPSYVYSDPGEYTVTVRVHDDEGITDEDTATVTVYGYYPPTADAGGTYYAMEEYGNEPDDPVHFDGSGSHDNDEHYFHNGTGYCIVNWTWNFGDGNIGYGKKVNHSYADEGTYTVTLIVTDNEGNTSSDTATAVIYGYYPPVAVPGGPYYGINSESVQFDGSNSHDNDENGNSIVRYDWKFFDGDSWHNDTGVTPSHTYYIDGTYTVSLRVWDDEDPSSYNISNTTVTITHYNDPTADAGGPYTGKAYIPVTFDASASHDNDEGGCCITGYRWDWENDGVWDTGWLTTPTAQHTYLLGFTGNVRVQVKDDDGSHVGYDEDTAPVNIAGNPPTADFQIIKTNNPAIFKFDASSSIDPRPGCDHHHLNYKWDFNNDGIWDKTGNWYSAGIV
ncbi:MAG TPA: PKD domain-containing protein, partial [Thermoplasmatales archaeon]|nr:PKD domain-containing protein [Thermoplasmatales archaeon]